MPIILRLDRVMADRKMSLNELSERVGVANVNLSKLKNNLLLVKNNVKKTFKGTLNSLPGTIKTELGTLTFTQNIIEKKWFPGIVVLSVLGVIFSDKEYFAIRSSAGNEDSKENSFAGQFDTFLYVKSEDVIRRIKDVYMSVFSERIDSYRKENNILEICVPSVVVQKMVNSEKAGVAFGANPVNSNIKEIFNAFKLKTPI